MTPLMKPEVIMLFVAPDGAQHWLFADTSKADVLAHNDYAHLCRLAARTGVPLLAETPSTFLDLVQTVGLAVVQIDDVALSICEIAIHIAMKRDACAEALLMMQILVFGCLGIVVNETALDALALCAQTSDDYEIHSRRAMEAIRQAKSGILTLDPCIWQLRHGAHLYRPGFAAARAPACLWKSELVTGTRNTNEQAVIDDFEKRSPAARYLFYESVLVAFGPPFCIRTGPLIPEPRNLFCFLPSDLVPPPAPLVPDVPPMQFDEQFMQTEYSEPMDLLHDMDSVIDDTSRSLLHESYRIPILGSVSPHDAANAMFADEAF